MREKNKRTGGILKVEAIIGPVVRPCYCLRFFSREYTAFFLLDTHLPILIYLHTAMHVDVLLQACTRSSVDRATDCGSVGRRFETSRVRQIFPRLLKLGEFFMTLPHLCGSISSQRAVPA